jgi:hypothetical protein
MKIQNLLRKHGFSVYYAKTGTEYWTGFLNNKEVIIRISNHPPKSSFIDNSGDILYRNEPDYRIDPEQDDSEIIKKALNQPKDNYMYILTVEDWKRPKNRYRVVAYKIKPESISGLEDYYKIISYKDYMDFKKKHKDYYYFTDEFPEL